MSMYICNNDKEEAYWEQREKETEALEILRCELSTYIENTLDAGELPNVIDFMGQYHYSLEVVDQIERHFDEVLKGFQGTMEVGA